MGQYQNNCSISFHRRLGEMIENDVPEHIISAELLRKGINIPTSAIKSTFYAMNASQGTMLTRKFSKEVVTNYNSIRKLGECDVHSLDEDSDTLVMYFQD